MKETIALSGLREAARLPPGRLHLAIGMFDGVHLGHQAVVDTAVHSARREGGVAAVLTFWPHPSRLFRPQEPVPQIQQPSEKVRQLAALGVDAVIIEDFTPEFAAMEAEKFVPLLKRALPTLAAIYVGENWRFGRGRQGDVALLIAEGKRAGLSVVSAPRVNFDGEPISSTRIRGLLQAGEIETANALLGYDYQAEGVVTPGKQLGRRLGFPTLNIAWAPELIPRLGVYAVRIRAVGGESTPPGAGSNRVGEGSVEESKGLPGVANFGLRPTVETALAPRLEVHVLGEGNCPLGAGDRVQVGWLKFLRPEMKFADVDALREQIAADRRAAAAYFQSRTP